MTRVLLVYPEFPPTYWSFHYALRFVGKRAALPPLGLLTVAALLPDDWDVRLVDLNVERLKTRDLRDADLVMVGAMVVQQKSTGEVMRRAKALGKTVVGGGPLFSCEPDKFPEVDHVVLGEAELSLPPFLDDFARGVAKPRYEAHGHASMDTVPIPRWDLLSFRHYQSMALQFSRGCPFHCDFCNVTALFGRVPRTKSTAQVLAELNSLWDAGWRSSVFFVDDNFIGNKRFLKRDLLPALIGWQQGRGLPLYTEASINLADDEELMDQMSQAGFDTVFVGLETPTEEALTECNKKQNTGRDLVACIKRIQRRGLQVQGGFIVGFDSDTPNIFARQLAFIQQSGVVTAMVGILQAPVGTALHERMSREGRLTGETLGDNTDIATNIIPKMDLDALFQGYRALVSQLYHPHVYYERLRIFLAEYRLPPIRAKLNALQIRAFCRSVLRLGVIGRERVQFWRLLGWTLRTKPRLLPTAVTLAILGFHFRKIAARMKLPEARA